jgi:hypothetical protein
MRFKKSKKLLLGLTLSLSSVLSVGSVLLPTAQVYAATPPAIALDNNVSILAGYSLGVDPMYASLSIGEIIPSPNGNVAYYVDKSIGNGYGNYTKYLTFAYYDARSKTNKVIKTDSYAYSGSSMPPTMGSNGRYIAFSNLGLTSVTLYDTVTGTTRYINSQSGKISNGVRISVTDKHVVFLGSNNSSTIYDITTGVTTAKVFGTSYFRTLQPEGTLLAIIDSANGGSNNQIKLVDITGSGESVAYQVKNPNDRISQLYFIDKDTLIIGEYVSVPSPTKLVWHAYNLKTKRDRVLNGVNLSFGVQESNGYLTDSNGDVYSLASDKTIKLTASNYPYRFAVAGDSIYSGRSMTSIYNGNMNIVKYQTTVSSILPPTPQQNDLQQPIADLQVQLTNATTKEQLDAVQTQLNTLQEQLNASPASADKDTQQASLTDIQNTLNLRYATLTVGDAENASKGDLSNQTLIDNAMNKYNTALSKVNSLPDSTGKGQLQTRLAVVAQTIEAAQNILNAQNGVANATTISNADLSTQLAIDTAKQSITDSQALVNKLPDSNLKTALQNAINDNNTKVQLAQDILNAKNGVASATSLATSDLSTQALIDSANQAITDAQALVNKLPDGDIKTGLQNAINDNNAKVQLAQYILNAKNGVDSATSLATSDLSTQALIDSANQAITDAQALVNKLPDGDIKTGLQNSLNDDTAKVQLAQDILNAKNGVASANSLATFDLSTQALIDSANQAITDAQALVNKLPEGDIKTSLQTQLDADTVKVNTAQATLNVQTAEQTKTQVSVDTANASIAKLPAGDVQTSLTKRIAIVQQYININNGLDSILNGTLKTYETIDASVTTLNTVKTSLDTYPDGADKDTLTVKYQKSFDLVGKSLEDLLNPPKVKNGRDGNNEEQQGNQDRFKNVKPYQLTDNSLDFFVRYADQQVKAKIQAEVDKYKKYNKNFKMDVKPEQMRELVKSYVQSVVKEHATGKRVDQVINKYYPQPVNNWNKDQESSKNQNEFDGSKK